MRKRRCAAMLGHRGCNDDAAHNDHIPRPDHDGARRTAAGAKNRAMPIGLLRERWILRPDVGSSTSRDPEARAMPVRLHAIGQLLHRHAKTLTHCAYRAVSRWLAARSTQRWTGEDLI